jgi:hypothetical protein
MAASLSDKDVRAIRYRLAFKEGVDKKKELAILVTGRIQIFLISPRELPVIKERIAMSFRCWVRIQSRRQYRSHGSGIRSELDIEEIGGIVPGRRRVSIAVQGMMCRNR